MSKNKRPVISKEQRQAFIKGCQESPLTVEAYAKNNKVAPSSLYRWAELDGVSLKPGKKTKKLIKVPKRKTSQEQSTLPETEASRGSKSPKGGKMDKEPLEMPEFEFTYTFKDFSKLMKEAIKKAFSKKG